MKFNCPYCQKLLEVPDNSVGRTGTCPKCGRKVRIPPPKPRVRNHGYPDLELEPEPEPVAPQRSYAWPDETVYPSPRRSTSSLPTSAPSEPSKAFGCVRTVCTLVVIVYVVLRGIGWLTSKSDTKQQTAKTIERHARLRKQSNGGISSKDLCEQGCHYLQNDEQWEAVECFEKAATRGYADGQYFLGFCYATGKGVAKDLEEAKRWLEKAANQGHAEAKMMLRSVNNTIYYESASQKLRYR